MRSKLRLAAVIAFGIAYVSVALGAEQIQLDQDELQRETVLPKFDRPDVVKNRNVISESKIEVAPFLGAVVTEPIYGQNKFGVNLAYNWDEDGDVAINFSKFLGGLNPTYTKQLQANSLDFNRAPKENFALYLNYESKFAYGKMSLAKHSTMNLSTFFIAGVGATSFTTKMEPAIDFGLGQRFYFTKTVALRFDFKFAYMDEPSPFLPAIRTDKSLPPPQAADFKDKFTLHNIVELGMSFLF